MVQNLYRKADAWAYEKEYRVLAKRGDVTQVISSEALAGIILGARMCPSDRECALDLALQQGLPVYEAYVEPHSFSILHKRLVP